MQEEKEDVQKNSVLVAPNIAQSCGVFWGVSWTFRLLKMRTLRCLKQIGPSYPVTGRYVSEEHLPYLSRLDDGQAIVNFTFS